MRISVLPREGERSDRLVYEFRREVVRIGRRRSSDVRLPDRAVSLDHARIVRSGSEFYVTDAHSTNGTKVGAQSIEPGRRHALRTGDVLRLGPFSLLFEGREVTHPSETTSEETALFARRILREVALGRGSDAACPYLEVVAGAEEGARLRLPPRDGDVPYRIGRSPDCDLVLCDPDASRDHVALIRDFAGVRARDLDSKNGLLLNGRTAQGERPLVHGDEIGIGATRLRFADPIEEQLSSLDRDDLADPLPEPWRGERAAVWLAATALVGCIAVWVWLLAF